MPNLCYHLSRDEGAAKRKVLSAILPAFARSRIVKRKTELPFEVFSYSSEASLPEQVVSIRSFLRHAGQPEKWTVVSDGTHCTSSLDLLRSIDPVVAVSQPDE